METIPPMFGDLYLKFADAAEAEALLDGYEGAIDVVGTIYKPTGVVFVTENGDVPEMAAIPGWHVNTRGPLLDTLLPYAVTPEPTTPTRTWL